MATTLSRERTHSRPPRDASASRERILDAATAEFARHGLGGARVDRIAEQAEANKALIYYYFGDKDGLFRAVLERMYEGIRNAEQGLHLLDLAPMEAIERLVEFTWRYYLEHPEFLSLLNSENLHQGRHLEHSEVRAVNLPLVATLTEILRRGEAQGVFRPGVDALHLYISIAALGYFYLSNQHTLSQAFGRDLRSPAQRDLRLEHMVAMVAGFLTNRDAPTPDARPSARKRKGARP